MYTVLYRLCKQKFARTDPVAMVTKNLEFQHKIGYNSPYLKDITHTLAPSRGFWGSACLKEGDSQKLLRLTPAAMVTKICEFQHKNGYNSGCIRHITQISAPVWGYSESAHLRVSEEFAQTDPVAMVTKNREF